MAGGSLIFKLGAIIMAISFNNNIMNNKILVIAQVLVEHQWDPSSTCFLNTTQQIMMRGKPSPTCILQVMSSNGTHIRIQITGRPKKQIKNFPSFLYIERNGDLENCLNKYVVFGEQSKTCNSIITDTNIKVVLQGKVALFIKDVPVIERLSKCNREDGYLPNSENVSQVSNCSNVREYDNKVSCNQLSGKKCRIKIPSNCGATLGSREVIYQQCYNVSKKFTAMMTYHIQTEVLDLSDNNIVEIIDHAFAGLVFLKTLDLSRNKLFTLGTETFRHLLKLGTLSISNNLLDELPIHTFQHLTKVRTLYLDGNQIRNLNAGIFVGLSKLRILVLSDNLLTALPNGTFQSTPEIGALVLDDNLITNLSAEAFVGLNRLFKLSLNRNLLSSIPNEIFHNIPTLQVLNIHENNIVYLNPRAVAGLSKLLELKLSNNLLSELPNETFQDLHDLEVLYLNSNQLQNLQTGLFTGLHRLQALLIQRNMLKTIGSGIFHNLTDLELISLEKNRLMYLPNNVFGGLENLKYLYISDNKLVQISNGIFKGLAFLKRLILSNNRLSQLDYNMFEDTVILESLDLSSNFLNAIPNIEHLNHLQMIYITNNKLLFIYNTSFYSLSNNSNIFVSQQEVCVCYVPDHINCSAANDRSPYLTCNRLLTDRTLVVFMWLIGLGALSGNIFVLLARNRGSHKKKVNSILLRNLAASDLLMGIYMLTLASADIYFGDNFPMQSESWRSGITCKIIGAMSIISSEASVFFVTIISIDRLIAIKFPYSTRKLGKHSVKVVGTVIWTISFVLGIVPSVLSGTVTFKFYDNSHVCIGLPLSLIEIYDNKETSYERVFSFAAANIRREDTIFTTQNKGLSNGLFFSTALFLGLNCVCYMIILACYIEIVRAVRASSKDSGRSQEMAEQIKLTVKVTTIVATDFFCWFPIILLGILVQLRVIQLPPSVYAWCVTFVLPINSGINPYLYTITEVVSEYRKKLKKKNGTADKTKTAA